MVFDSVISAIGVEKIEITASMVYSAMNALSWYKDKLKGMKQEKELKTMKLKLLDKAVKDTAAIDEYLNLLKQWKG